MPLKTHLLAATLAAGFSMIAGATHVGWSPSDTFEHTQAIAPGKSAEVCGQIEPRLPVRWRYAADGPLNFNIHRHAGEEIIYSVKSFLTQHQEGILSPTLGFEWCWMWTNPSAVNVTLRLDLKR